MPDFMQFLAGTYLFLGLTLFGTFKDPVLQLAALAFTAYGVHWFAMGWIRLRRRDPRVNAGMAVAFTLISILGIIVFFGAHDNPVGGLFIGLTGIYVTDFFASLREDLPGLGRWGERGIGLFHIGTGFWLIYPTYAVALNFVLKYTLPV